MNCRDRRLLSPTLADQGKSPAKPLRQYTNFVPEGVNGVIIPTLEPAAGYQACCPFQPSLLGSVPVQSPIHEGAESVVLQLKHVICIVSSDLLAQLSQRPGYEGTQQ